MDIRRVILVVALSFAVLMGWRYLSEFLGFAPSPASTSSVETSSTELQEKPDTPIVPQSKIETSPAYQYAPVDGKKIKIETPLITASLYSGGGLLESLELNKFRVVANQSGKVALVNAIAASSSPMGLLINGVPTWSEGTWALEGGNLNLTGDATGAVAFTAKIQGLKVRREYTFSANSYIIIENLNIINENNAPVELRIAFTLSTPLLNEVENSYNITKVGYYTSSNSFNSEAYDSLEGGIINDSIKWASIQNNYFIAAIIPQVENAAFRAKLQNDIMRIAVEDAPLHLPAGAGTSLSTNYYLGPKNSDYLKLAPENLNAAMDYGWFGFISEPLIWLLEFFNSYIHNYGVAIIILTLFIKLLFWPLSRKSYKSMEKMKQLQPHMKKLQEQYADDKRRLQQEMMQLYKTYKVNPVGGCLPILLQFPVLLGLYYGLSNAVSLRQAVFIEYLPFTDIVWLADLSLKDPLYITPLLMGASSFLLQKLTPAPGDPTQAKLLMLMPLVFTFICLQFPSGLVLYWFVGNLFTIGQQWFMLRKVRV